MANLRGEQLSDIGWASGIDSRKSKRKEPLTQNRVLLLSSCSVVSDSLNRTCLGFNSFSYFLPVRFQADSLISMRFHSLPVKWDNDTPPVQSGF